MTTYSNKRDECKGCGAIGHTVRNCPALAVFESQRKETWRGAALRCLAGFFATLALLAVAFVITQN